MRFYRKEHDIENEKRILRVGIDWNENVLKLKARLDYLESNNPQAALPTRRVKVPMNIDAIGDRYREVLTNLRENYWCKHIGDFRPLSKEEEKLDAIYEETSGNLWEMCRQAEAAEAGNNYVEAARLYETLVANRFFSCQAYDRLIVIYNKAKLYDVVEEVLEEAINQAQQSVFTQNDESKLIKRWGERLTRMRERRNAKSVKETRTPKTSAELVDMQKRFCIVESEFGKLQITMIDDEIWFNGRDVCFAIGYTDPKRPMQTHCRNAIMLKYPAIGANGILTSRTGKFIPMNDVQRMIAAYSIYADEEKAKCLKSLQEWLNGLAKEYVRKHRNVVNISIDKQVLAELERQTKESQSVLSEIF